MRTVGASDQYSIMCMQGLASDLFVAAEYDRARELNEEALRGRSTCSGQSTAAPSER